MKAYKHDIYLIERTKLLEGIVCQSITFTNTLGRTYLTESAKRLISPATYLRTSEGFPLATETNLKDSNIKEILDNIYRSPVEVGKTISVYTPYWLAGAILNTYTNETGRGDTVWIETATLTIKNGAETQTYDQSNTNRFIELIAKDSISYQYDISYEGLSYTLDEDGAIDVSQAPVRINDRLQFTYIIAGIENRYPTKPYSITDCINRVLELAEPLYVGQNPRYVLDGVTYENGEIKPYSETQKYVPNSLAEKYDKIQAPEFSMTQCTLREQLKIIGSFIHAEPRLEYPNKITFQDYARGTEAEIGKLPYIQEAKEQSLNEYCTEVVSNAQNLVNSINYAKGVIIEPNLNYYKTVRTETVNAKLSEPTSLFETQCPIYSVQKLMVGMYNSDGTWAIEPVDITPFVFERHEYNNLSSYSGAYPYVKSYAVYYTQGENNIDGLFYKPSDNVLGFDYLNKYAIVNILASTTGKSISEVDDYMTNGFQYLAMNITYIPVFSAMFSHGKQYRLPSPQQPFQTVYNQSENLIESSWYGENIKGVSARLGNVEQTRTYKVKNKALIPRVGQTIDGYFISSVSTDLTPFYYKVTVGLTKFNRISQYVGINSTKRVSEVSEKQAYMRNILIKEYICLGDDIGNDTAIVCGSKVSTLKMFDPTEYENSYNNPLTACISGTRAKNKTDYIHKTMLPVVSSAMGNTMTFCWLYKDNYSAGTEITVTDNDGNWQTDVPYGDYYGRAFWYDFQLLNNAKPGTDAEALKRALTCGYTGEFDTNGAFIGTKRAFLYTDFAYRLRKDSREILNFNYCLEYVTNREDLNIGSALASCNPLVSKYDGRTPKVYFFNEEIDKLGATIKTLKPIGEATVTIENTDEIHFTIPSIDFKSWAIAYPVVTDENPTLYSDEDGETIEIYNSTGGEILLSSNKSKEQYANVTDEVITISLFK